MKKKDTGGRRLPPSLQEGLTPFSSTDAPRVVCPPDHPWDGFFFGGGEGKKPWGWSRGKKRGGEEEKMCRLGKGYEKTLTTS